MCSAEKERDDTEQAIQHLEAALKTEETDEVTYHIQDALQLLQLPDED